MSGHTLRRALWSVVALCALAGCATRPVAPALPDLTGAARTQAEAGQRAREQTLSGYAQWSFSGRIAVSVGSKGGSGRIDWNQDGAAYEAALSAPVTRQSWRLIGDTHHEAARLEGLEGGPREGEFAEDLLEEATGWRIPVNQMPDWVRGIAMPLSGAPPQTAYGADGRLRSIEQLGWKVEYQEWMPAQGARPELPRRILARSGQATVRLIVDEWELPAR
ncbi:lipoprotein insertase outer membrane protein LolB [Lysobacter terrae]